MSINRDNFEEHLFKASEKHAYAFQENDWDVLEALLEKKKKRRAFVFWLNGLGLLLIASSFAVYFAMQGDSIEEAEHVFTTEEVSVAENAANPNDSSESSNTINTLNTNTTHQTIEDAKQAESNAVAQNGISTSTFLNNTPQQRNNSNNSSNNSNSNYNNNSNNNNNNNNKISNQIFLNPPNNEESKELPKEQAEINIITAEMEMVAKVEDTIQLRNLENSTPKKLDSLLANNDSLDVKPDSLLAKLNNDTIAKLVSTEKKKKVKDSTSFSRVSLLFSVTPDLSFTQLVDFSKLQLSGYLGAEVNITRNFSAVVGAAYANKSYAARGSDYTPGKPKFWTGGVKPQEVSGTCAVIDMSVALRYYHAFNSTGKTRFFAEAGSSSYLMMKEHYDFIYANPNPSLIQEWNVKSGIVYSFSVLNFGIGVERKINEHWMIQANPKFQMPLSALGWGSVKFSSAGLNMTLKYSF
jgi:hypothetical protein